MRLKWSSVVKFTDSAIGFAVANWALSRLLVLLCIYLIAPALPENSNGAPVPHDWQALTRWDGKHYLTIATRGYEYAENDSKHTIAFFPALPLVMRIGMMIGIPPEVAGIIVNNLAFLGGLILLSLWVTERHGQKVARWATIALAWCPFSLFGTVLYTEGLFLLFSTAALRSFDQRRHGWAALWGSFASFARLPGLMLVPAFLLVSWRERRGPWALACSLAAAGGTLLYSLFCLWQYGDPLAFLKVQKAWHPPGLAYGEGWIKSLVTFTLGPGAWKAGRIVDPLYPIAFFGICGLLFLVWRFHHRLGKNVTFFGGCTLGALLWLLAGSPFINTLMVFGSIGLLWSFRRELAPVAVIYGFFSAAMILSTGRTISAERHMYAVIPVSIAFALLVSRYPRWGYPVWLLFTLMLASLSVRFAQYLWAG